MFQNVTNKMLINGKIQRVKLIVSLMPFLIKYALLIYTLYFTVITKKIQVILINCKILSYELNNLFQAKHFFFLLNT